MLDSTTKKRRGVPQAARLAVGTRVRLSDREGFQPMAGTGLILEWHLVSIEGAIDDNRGQGPYTIALDEPANARYRPLYGSRATLGELQTRHIRVSPDKLIVVKERP